MFYITGDIHGELSVGKLSHKNWPIGRTLSRNDYVVILGDFGLIWNSEPSKCEKYWLDWLNDKPWTTLVIDGNHENFDRINDFDEFPIELWNGGRIQRFRPNVIHLMRGEVYDIDNIKVLAFGGANSIDKKDRTEGESWWAAEMPSEEERINCIENLEKNNNEVDLILTHEAPAAAFYSCLVGFDHAPDKLSFWLQTNINEQVAFDRWYFGHHHIDKVNATPLTPLYDCIVEYKKEVSPCKDGIATEDYAEIWEKLL